MAHNRYNPRGAGDIIKTNTRTRDDWHPTLDTPEKRRLVLECLKGTRCPMTFQQVCEWVYRNERVALTFNEARYYLRKLHAEGLAVHPTPEQTHAFKYQRPNL